MLILGTQIGIEFLIPTIISIYGAILSTILAIHQLRKNKAKIRVSVKLGRYYNATHKPSEPAIIFEAINVGSGKVSLTTCGWLLKDKTVLQIIDPYPKNTIPHFLEERKNVSVGYPCRLFKNKKNDLKIIGVYFKDETGKFWKKRVSKKEINLWISAKNEGWHFL